MWRALKQSGVIGLNRRNRDYIMRYNPRRLYPLVDDKLTTKRLAQKAGIAVPELYAVVETQPQIREFLAKRWSDFVIKPSRGSGGEGIIVILSSVKNGYRKSDGTILRNSDISDHFTKILGGVYSLGGHPDKALVEYRVCFDPVFEDVSYLGVPDIRIIVFLGVPVAGMLRLPTRQSGGKANLHQGAVGVGIDIGSGITTSAVCANTPCYEHPDTGASLGGIKVPHWEKFLTLAAGAYELTGLGYLGVDLVLDRDKGPLLLELNARPGLAIQIANDCGIGTRLEIVEASDVRGMSLEDRLEFARRHFSESLFDPSVGLV
jgi:alpha-L-glutamate ligase-like protein